jgi:O-acetylserine/cysteine efflux transporter
LSPLAENEWLLVAAGLVAHGRRVHSIAGQSALRTRPLKPIHILMAVAVAAIWGFNFVAIRWGLDEFPPILLAALRFSVAALPALVVPRPAVPLALLVAVGAAWFVAQFGLLFLGMQAGMPPGLASVLMQSQVFFTVLFAALALGERPRRRHLAGIAVAAAGVLAIGATVGGEGGDMTLLGLALVLTAAACWAVGNIVMRRVGPVEFLPMIVWLSVVAPLPLLALSLAFEGPEAIARSLAAWTWRGLGSTLFQGLVSTIVAYGMWSYLLRLYAATLVAPYSLLVPVFGMFSAALVFGEQFGPLRLLGTALILIGVAVVALPAGALARRRRA